MRSTFTSTTEFRPEQAIATQPRPRIFHGWRIAAARVALLTLFDGIGFYGLGVFLPSPEGEFEPARPRCGWAPPRSS